MERWCGKIAVITGASSGIGLATARKLVRHGLVVVGLARRLDVMRDGMKDAKGPGEFHARQCDVSDEKNVTEVIDGIRSTFKSVDVLVNNAAVMQPKTIEDSSTREIETVFKVNVFGLLYCTKRAIELMKENQTEGHIINVNSVLGHKVLPDLAANVYPASKFAVTALSESLTNELRNTKIRVTSISPGPVQTDMFGSLITQFSHQVRHKIPVLQPEDVANSIVHALGAPSHVEINEITLQPKRA